MLSLKFEGIANESWEEFISFAEKYFKDAIGVDVETILSDYSIIYNKKPIKRGALASYDSNMRTLTVHLQSYLKYRSLLSEEQLRFGFFLAFAHEVGHLIQDYFSFILNDSKSLSYNLPLVLRQFGLNGQGLDGIASARIEDQVKIFEGIAAKYYVTCVDQTFDVDKYLLIVNLNNKLRLISQRRAARRDIFGRSYGGHPPKSLGEELFRYGFNCSDVREEISLLFNRV